MCFQLPRTNSCSMLELNLSEQSMQILPPHSLHCLKFPVKPRESVQTSPPQGKLYKGFVLQDRGPSELISSPTKDTDVLLMLNGNSWGWMRNGQMRDTKMSDSLPTVVAMRSNSQHQSDKLSDRMVQPWHGTTLATRQDTRAGSNRTHLAPALPTLGHGAA